MSQSIQASDITISGPGLVVNGPALIIIQALKNAGYKVNYDNWHGLDQWQKIMTTKEMLDKAKVHNSACDWTIDITVDPLPWGG